MCVFLSSSALGGGLVVSGGAPGPRPAEAPSFINIRLADELAATGRTFEHAQGAARAGSSFAKLG